MDQEVSFFDRLLDIVQVKSKENLQNLENDLNVLINENKQGWNELIKWDMNCDENDFIRQDKIVNGIVSTYSESDLIHNASSTFNSKKFYDYKDYLPKLVLLAHMVDDEFHLSIENIFNINKKNGIGYLTSNSNQASKLQVEIDSESKTNDNNGAVTTGISNSGNRRTKNKNKISYMRGPVKLYSRALSKSENDYNNELYPTSGCVLDFNRCALTFKNIETLLSALNLFVNKVKYYQSGNIIKIVRCKNTFQKYVNDGAGYADIKLNVIIKGKTNNIIGEVQFLLEPMLKFKKRGHSIYSIQRQKSFVKTSLSLILPQLLDKNKQLFVAGNMGNVKKICQIMVLNNLDKENIMKINNENKRTILHGICRLGHKKAFEFVQSIVAHDLFMDRLLTKNTLKNTSVDLSVSSVEMFKQLLSNKDIINKYISNPGMLVNLIDRIAGFGTSETLQVLIEAIGDAQFVKHGCIANLNNTTILERAIWKNKIDIIKIVLSYKKIKEQYTTSQYWLFRLLFHLFASNHDMTSTIDYVMNELKLTHDIDLVLNTMFDYHYNETISKDTLKKHACSYTRDTILSCIGWNGNYRSLKKLISIIGDDKRFITNVLKPGPQNTTILENAIGKEKIEMIKIILSYNEIRDKIKQSKYWLFRTLWWVLRSKYDSSNTIKYVINKLNLSKDDIIDVVTNYQYQEMKTAKVKFIDDAVNYNKNSILRELVWNGNYISLKTLISFVGEKEISKFVFIRPPVSNTTMFECAIGKNKTKMITLIISLDDVKNVYQADSYWIYRLFWWYEKLKLENKNALFKDILTDLELAKETAVNVLKHYQYREKIDPNFTFDKNAVEYNLI